MALADLVKTRHKARTTGKILIPQLDEFLLLREDSDRRDGRFHPSDLAGEFCARAWVLYNHHPDGKTVRDGSWTPRLKRILDNGTHLHQRVQGYFADMGILWGRWWALDQDNAYHDGFHPAQYGHTKHVWRYGEVELRHDPDNILGSTDGLLKIDASWVGAAPVKRKDYYKLGLEIKSINSYGFKWLNNEPKPHHQEQALIYMHCLEWIRQEKAQGAFGGFVDEFDTRPLDGFIILYENKDTQDLEEFVVWYDEEAIQAVLEPKRPLMKQALSWKKGDPLPPCTCGKGYAESPLCKQLQAV